MRPLPALAGLTLALAIAGCVDTAAPAPAADDASLQTAAGMTAACEPAAATLLDWASPQDGRPEPTNETFTLTPGARNLVVDWTEASAMAGSVELRLTAPDGRVLVERILESGVVAAGSSISVFQSQRNGGSDEIAWPTPGDYTFVVNVEGAMTGAALVVTADVCGA